MEGKAKTRRKTWIQVFLNLPSPLLTSQFFVIKILSAVVVINGSWQEQIEIERDRQTDRPEDDDGRGGDDLLGLSKRHSSGFWVGG
jgi:hypothetical protein